MKKNIPIRLYALPILSILGLAFSIYLSIQFYEVRSGLAGFRSFCNLGQKFNCDAVAASPYAELFAGIPLSSFTAGWFLALTIIGFMTWSLQSRRDAIRVTFVMGLVGSVFSIAYLYVMARMLQTFCLFCLFIDFINFAIFGITASLRPGPLAKPQLAPGSRKSYASILIASLFVTIVGLRGMQGEQRLDPSMVREVAISVINSAPVKVNAGPEFPSLGEASAPITIVEFSDFQCPHCRNGALILNTLLNRYPGKVRVVLRNFPLDPACNSIIQHAGHPVACEAARTAVCAYQLGKFQPVYEGIFERQSTLKKGTPAEIAVEAGIDRAQLESCTSSAEIAAAVSRDIEEAKALGVQSTPTFFINGHKVEGAYPVPVWDELIQRLLKQ